MKERTMILDTTVKVDLYDLVKNLVDEYGYKELIYFIVCIDNEIDDIDFTKELYEKLGTIIEREEDRSYNEKR